MSNFKKGLKFGFVGKKRGVFQFMHTMFHRKKKKKLVSTRVLIGYIYVDIILRKYVILYYEIVHET